MTSRAEIAARGGEVPLPGRMTPNRVLQEARQELLSLSSGYRRVECDFGASKGKFLTESALLHPAVFFIGIEGLSERVARANRKITRARLSNVRLWRGWGHESLDELIPDDFLDSLHVSHPDPWPKRRHWFRRLVQGPFLEVACRKLKKGIGQLKLQTDHHGYFVWMQDQVSQHGGWIETDWKDGLTRPITEFETIFLAKGEPIYRMALQRS